MTDTKVDTKPDTSKPAAVDTARSDAKLFADDVDAIMADLVDMHRKAIEAGHTLTEVLVVAAKNAFGIDIRPTPPAPEA
jgi:hypothetical protein